MPQDKYAHPNTTITLLALREQVGQKISFLLKFVLHILLDLTPAQAWVTYFLFHKSPWFFAQIERNIDRMTLRQTNFWYIHIMGSFIKTLNAFGKDTRDPFRTPPLLNNFFETQGKVYGATLVDFTPMLNPLLKSRGLELSRMPLMPVILNQVVSWLGEVIKKKDQVSFDENTMRMITSFPVPHKISAMKSGFFPPVVLIAERNGLPPVEAITACAQALAGMLGSMLSMYLYSWVRVFIIQAGMQIALYCVARCLNDYILPKSSTLPHTEHLAQQQCSALTRCNTLCDLITLLSYTYFLSRVVKTVRLFFIPRHAHELPDFANEANDIQSAELSALYMFFLITYQLIGNKITDYKQPATRLKIIEKLNVATACIKGSAWQVRPLNFSTKCIIVFDATHGIAAGNAPSMKEAIPMVTHACIKNGVGVLHTSGSHIAIKDTLLSDRQYAQLRLTIIACLKKYQDLQAVQAAFIKTKMILAEKQIIKDAAWMGKVVTLDGDIQWRTCLTIEPPYVFCIDFIATTFASIFSEYRVDIHLHTLVVLGDTAIDQGCVEKNIRVLVDALVQKKVKESTNNSGRYSQDAVSFYRHASKKNAHPSPSGSELGKGAPVNKDEGITVVFNQEYVYASRDGACRIKPLCLPWAPDNTIFVSVTPELEAEYLVTPALRALFLYPHFVQKKGQQGFVVNTLSDFHGFTSPLKVKLLAKHYGDLRLTCSQEGVIKTQDGKVLYIFDQISSHRALELGSRA